MKKLLFTTILVSASIHLFAQDFVDNALLFSRTQPGGSARIQALGGVQISLGGDYSSALSNPAGLGMYNKSEATLSMGVTNNQTTSSFFGNASDANRTTFNIPGFSYVHRQDNAKDKFQGGTIGVTFSRINNFNTTYRYEGDNDQSSLIDFFINDSQGRLPEDMLYGGYDFYSLTGLAYNNYLTQDFEDNGETVYGSVLTPLPDEVRTVHQLEEVIRKGAQSQLSVSYGGNYDDTFFFGAGMGIVITSFEQTQVFEESNFRYSLDASYNPLTYFRTNENFDIQGSGVNFSFGGIYRPLDFLQVGVSYITPTYYTFTDSYTASVEGEWNDFDYFGDGSLTLESTSEEFDVPFISEYDLRTPGKASLGVTFINKRGFISGDVEFINYGKAKYSSQFDGESYEPENDAIQQEYRNAVNYRIGAEFRHNMYRVRLGYNHQGNPYNTNTGTNIALNTLSGGAGLRFAKFFIDMAIVHAVGETLRVPYNAGNLPSPKVAIDYQSTHYMLTLGLPF